MSHITPTVQKRRIPKWAKIGCGSLLGLFLLMIAIGLIIQAVDPEGTKQRAAEQVASQEAKKSQQAADEARKATEKKAEEDKKAAEEAASKTPEKVTESMCRERVEATFVSTSATRIKDSAVTKPGEGSTSYKINGTIEGDDIAGQKQSGEFVCVIKHDSAGNEYRFLSNNVTGFVNTKLTTGPDADEAMLQCRLAVNDKFKNPDSVKLTWGNTWLNGEDRYTSKGTFTAKNSLGGETTGTFTCTTEKDGSGQYQTEASAIER